MAGTRSEQHWTTLDDLRRQVERLWERGVILAHIARGGGTFPRRLALKRPTSAETRDSFEGVRAWSASLRSVEHVRLIMRESRHRVLGTNALPHEAWVDSVEAAAAMIGKRQDVAAFQELLGLVAERQPSLVEWLARKPLKAMELRHDWSRLLGIVEWLQAHPRPGIYVRQMDVAGVDTKFVGKHRGVLQELLDLALPPRAIDSFQKGATGFAGRYGFKPKPERVRFRILDKECALLPWGDAEDGQELTLGIKTFSALDMPIRRVIITENEVNYLALPPLRRTVAIFGAGYGFETLGQAKWLTRCRLYYWGDIDTHGFAILDQLRGHFGSAESMLMDVRTFLRFKSLWVSEHNPTQRRLSRLSPAEGELYDELRTDKYGPSLRLEQERIGFTWVRDALSKLPDTD